MVELNPKYSKAASINQPEWLKPNTLPKSARDTQQEYDQISHTYDAFVQAANYQSPQATTELLTQFVLREDNDVSKTSAILDAGCGTGLVGLELANHGFTNITGVDVSENVLKQAKAKGAYINLVQGDLLGSLPFPEEYFSAVVCIGVFSRFSDEQILDILAEFSRITQQDGLILFSHREDLISQSQLRDLLTCHPRFKVECITQPLPYLPDAVGYENVGVHYIVLKNMAERLI
jgi:ubiquinone/menaquinone biosynthesis C-methylase UbiE